MKKIFVHPRMVIIEVEQEDIVTQSLNYGGADCHSLDDEEAVAGARSRRSIWDDEE